MKYFETTNLTPSETVRFPIVLLFICSKEIFSMVCLVQFKKDRLMSQLFIT